MASIRPKTEEVVGNTTERLDGVKILSRQGFAERQKEIVDSSFTKARAAGEKLVGKNVERRVDAYISRLERAVEKGGNKLERRLWEMSAEKLLDSGENIPYANRILQRDSANEWANYLGDENCSFPMWFKVYAWDGMSKLSQMDSETKEFKKRDPDTIAPYPDFDAEALAKVYDSLSEELPQDEEDSEKLRKMVNSGNFGKLYAHFVMAEKNLVKTPEKTEDVRGAWKEYNPGDEKELAKASTGTGWCVASSSQGKFYLGLKDDSHPVRSFLDKFMSRARQKMESKFILFHLTDPKTEQLSNVACASIRLQAGKVKEISGLKKGQALEDSLVPIVEEKAMGLPGGEEFANKFADKKALIVLDKKMQSEEDLTQEELRFIHQIDRPLETLDSYNSIDPRAEKLLGKYDLAYAFEHGITLADYLGKIREEAGKFRWSMPNKFSYYRDKLSTEVETLLEYGASAEEITTYLTPTQAIKHLGQLFERGGKVDVADLARKLSARELLKNRETLENYGVNVDLAVLAQKTEVSERLNLANDFREAGIEIDARDIMSKMSLRDRSENYTYLKRAGVDPKEIAAGFGAKELDGVWIHLVNDGVMTADEVLEKFSTKLVDDYSRGLILNGADVNKVVAKMSRGEIKRNRVFLLEHGAKI